MIGMKYMDDAPTTELFLDCQLRSVTDGEESDRHEIHG